VAQERGALGTGADSIAAISAFLPRVPASISFRRARSERSSPMNSVCARET